MPELTRAGVRLHYETVGEGFPIVLQTGGGGSIAMWQHAGYVYGLVGYRRILFDQRGHGQSDRPQTMEAHRMEEYVADLAALLDHLGLEKVVFWGYSDGARIGYHFAAQRPKRLAALIVSGRPDDPDRAVQLADRQQFAEICEREGWAELIRSIEAEERLTLPSWLRRDFLDTDIQMFIATLRAWASSPGPWPLLEKIDTPTLIMVGAKEDPNGYAKLAASRLRRGRIVTLPGLGHVGAFLRSDLALPHARALLSEVVATGTRRRKRGRARASRPGGPPRPGGAGAPASR